MIRRQLLLARLAELLGSPPELPYEAPGVDVARRPTIAIRDDDPVLDAAAHGLATAQPRLSAASLRITDNRAVRVAAAALVVAFAIWPREVSIALVAVVTALYLAAVAFRLDLVRRSLDHTPVLDVSDDEARGIPDDDLPVYTVLVPLYGEPAVASDLVRALAAIEYPADKLDVKVLLEADDPDTIDAVASATGAVPLELLVLAPSEPRTKPKACNVGLARARGEFVTIYDAEDRPDPLQLRRAVHAFRADRGLSCIQAKLSYYNPTQNLITRWFTLEYAVWFSMLLPGLASLGAPIPLGGTSNHLRTAVLVDEGGWDAHNVTEDADLGIRLHRHGHRIAVLESTTYEEANSDAINWVKQRSRWYKGYLQTWLVHVRDRGLYRELGRGPFLAFNLFVGGTPLLTVLNPVFWALTALWFADTPSWINSIFPAPVYYAGLVSWTLGNIAVVYSGLVAARHARMPRLAWVVPLSPLYWMLMAAAAAKAFVQIVRAPTYWEKTRHGLAPASGAAT